MKRRDFIVVPGAVILTTQLNGALAAFDIGGAIGAATDAVKAASLSIWGRPVEPVPVGGGITNANFLVDDGRRRCFVRIGDDIPSAWA